MLRVAIRSLAPGVADDAGQLEAELERIIDEEELVSSGWGVDVVEDELSSDSPEAGGPATPVVTPFGLRDLVA
jgi:hypothetical protein